MKSIENSGRRVIIALVLSIVITLLLAGPFLMGLFN